MKIESLIGKKVKGFEFKPTRTLDFTNTMKSLIGKTGVINEYDESDKTIGITFGNHFFYYPAKLVIEQLNIHPLIITKQTKVRAGKKYYTWKFSKNKKTSNHQYNSAQTRNKQLDQFINDIETGNYEKK